MKLPPNTITIAISAIGVIGALWYYRNQQALAASQAAQADSNSGAASTLPLYQSAALPASTGSGGTSDISGSGLSSSDLAALTSSITSALGTSSNQATSSTLGEALISQFLGQNGTLQEGEEVSGDYSVSGGTTSFSLGTSQGSQPWYTIPTATGTQTVSTAPLSNADPSIAYNGSSGAFLSSNVNQSAIAPGAVQTINQAQGGATYANPAPTTVNGPVTTVAAAAAAA
jgi:hypothetical protein